MILIVERNEAWTTQAESLDLPLQKGLVILVDPAAVTQKDAGEAEPQPATPQPAARLSAATTATPNPLLAATAAHVPQTPNPLGATASQAPVECVLAEWRYRVKAGGESVLELTVDEVRLSWFDKASNKLLPTDENKFKAAVLMSILVAIPAALAAYGFSHDPDLAWELAGHHLRWIGGWTLFLVVYFVLPARLGLNRGAFRFQTEFLRALFFYAACGLVFAWLVLSRRPACFRGTPQDYANYAKSMAIKFSGSYWPVLLAVLPWAAVVFKVFGWETAEKTAEALRSTAKKE